MSKKIKSDSPPPIIEKSDNSEISIINTLYKNYRSNLKIDKLKLQTENYKKESLDIISKLNSFILESDDILNILQLELESKEKSIENIFKQRTNDLYKKYNAISKFKEEKDAVEKQIKAYKLELENLYVDHDIMKQNMDKKNSVEKEILKKNMIRQIKDTKLTLLAMTQDTLHPTTKRTQLENEQMTSELAYQSRECERLEAQNRAISIENQNMTSLIREKLNIHKDLATRTHFFNKLVIKLKDKIKAAKNVNATLANVISQKINNNPNNFATDELLASLKEREQELQDATYSTQESLSILASNFVYEKDQFDLVNRTITPAMECVLKSFENVNMDKLHTNDRLILVQNIIRNLEDAKLLEGLMADIKMNSNTQSFNFEETPIRETPVLEERKHITDPFTLPKINNNTPVKAADDVRPWGKKTNTITNKINGKARVKLN